MPEFDPKRLVTAALYRRWRRPCPFEEGYSLLLPSPMDMPFLLRYALEALAGMDLTHCREVLVVPDGWGDDGGAALRRAMAEVGGGLPVPLEYVSPTSVDLFVNRLSGRTNGAATHWMQAVVGVTAARSAHAFLHDSDAFFVDGDALERHYRACVDRGMYTLGVTARWDPLFRDRGYDVPGTWELMFSTRWARDRGPYALRGGWRDTPHGRALFDSMLHRQYLDYETGKVGILEPAPRIVHFNGTIVTYRNARDRAGPVVDELFRILLLAVLEDLMPSSDGPPELPGVDELARGLTDPKARVRYDTPEAARQWPGFRAQLDELCEAPTFQGDRAGRVRELLAPFDEHFAGRPATQEVASEPRMREHGLG
jgi:hypothetical protein